MKTPGPNNLKLQRAHGKRPFEPADAPGIDTIGWVLLTGDAKKYVHSDVRTCPDLYLVEGLNQVRRRGEFAVKKKPFTTTDTRGNEGERGETFKRTFSTQARRSTAMVQHEEPIRSS